jgi:hypothetical protein
MKIYRLIITVFLMVCFSFASTAQDCYFEEQFPTEKTLQDFFPILKSHEISVHQIDYKDNTIIAKLNKGELELSIRSVIEFEQFFDMPEVQIGNRTELSNGVLSSGIITAKDDTIYCFTVLLNYNNCMGYLITGMASTNNTDKVKSILMNLYSNI